MQELTHNNWTNHEKIINHLKNKKKIGVSHAWARQNDNTKELQVGCDASEHYSALEVYIDNKF